MSNKILGNIVLTVVLGAALVAGVFFYSHAATPEQRVLPAEGASAPDYDALIEHVSADALAADLDALDRIGMRMVGAPSLDEAGAYLAAQLEQAGYKVLRQPVEVTVPVTIHARLLDGSGRPIPDIEVHPMLPNWWRTPTTPEGGLAGTVYRRWHGEGREFASPAGLQVLADLSTFGRAAEDDPRPAPQQMHDAIRQRLIDLEDMPLLIVGHDLDATERALVDRLIRRTRARVALAGMQPPAGAVPLAALGKPRAAIVLGDNEQDLAELADRIPAGAPVIAYEAPAQPLEQVEVTVVEPGAGREPVDELFWPLVERIQLRNKPLVIGGRGLEASERALVELIIAGTEAPVAYVGDASFQGTVGVSEVDQPAAVIGLGDYASLVRRGHMEVPGDTPLLVFKRPERSLEVNPVGDIVLLPLGSPWDTVASMGADAVLYYDNPEATRPPGQNWNHFRLASANVPRAMVRGEIETLLDYDQVRLEMRVDFRTVTSHNIIGFMPGAEAAEDLLILSAHYDAFSYVPTLAWGAGPSAGVTTLLNVARHIATEQDALQRGVMVVFTTGHSEILSGARRLTNVFGQAGQHAQRFEQLTAELESLEDREEALLAAREVARDADYWQARGEEAEAAYWQDKPEVVREVFEHVLARTFDDFLMRASETLEERRLAWLRAGSPVPDPDDLDAPQPEPFVRYDRGREDVRGWTSLSSTPLGELKSQWPELREARARSGRELLALEEFGKRAADETTSRLAALQQRRQAVAADRALAELASRYQRLMMIGLDLSLNTQQLALASGYRQFSASARPADTEIFSQLTQAMTGLKNAATPLDYTTLEAGGNRAINLIRDKNQRDVAATSHTADHALWSFDTMPMLMGGHTALTITGSEARPLYGTPHDSFAYRYGKWKEDQAEAATEEQPAGPLTPEAFKRYLAEELLPVARIVAGAADRIVRGQGRFVPVSLQPNLISIDGQVVSQLGDSLVPNHPMGNSLVRFDAAASSNPFQRVPAGIAPMAVMRTDEDGFFSIDNVGPRMLGLEFFPLVSLDAARLNRRSGEVEWTLLETISGATGEYPVRGKQAEQLAQSKATAVIFRASPITLFPMPDPNTLKPYKDVGFLGNQTLAAPDDFKVESVPGLLSVVFVPLGEELYFTFKKGKANNPNMLEIRAFALNAEGPADGSEIDPGAAEIVGEGFAADTTPRVINPELDAAKSMAQVNARRIRQQQRQGMADDMLLAFNDRAVELAEVAEEQAQVGNMVAARQLARESLAYSSHNYPQARKNMSDAIFGIVWYLLLAIPFVIFLEKLLIGSNDIRKQLAWVGTFFLLFFLALRLLHPAYELVRSPYVILLGFVTLALALLVGFFIAGKFSRNVADAYRKAQNRVEAADVSRMGAAGTAIGLGLNNLRKRPMRTGLTVATLILITFVMISFASLRSDVVDIEHALGDAHYTGLLIRESNLADVKPSLTPLREVYGRNHVAPRAWAGNFKPEQGKIADPAEYLIKYPAKGTEATANAIIGLSPNEPLPLRPTEQQPGIFALFAGWFESPDEPIIYLPQTIAQMLQISEDAIRAEEAVVQIGGQEYTVLGVIDESRIENVFDFDGEPLLPINVQAITPEQVRNLEEGADEAATPEHVDRLPASQVVAMPLSAISGGTQVASIAVSFPDLEYAAARDRITSHLERSGEMTYYGLDGVSFYGGRMRRGTFEGLVDLLLPIIIAALTVLNTMYGSVYERRNELYVFNAVGLAPNHIRWLFFAEATVYAVVGVVGGYLLAQAMGTTLRTLNLTGGLTMNYSSIASVLVSLVIMIVVILSALLPARVASRLAAPAESMTRRRETAEGHAMELDLPFVFNQRDRIAIVPYFVDWFDNYGEGSAGEFFCSPPEAGLRADPESRAEPFVRTTAWLKPYDLGVSQTVELVVSHDASTNDNVAKVIMTRQSGDRESWERCNHSFIGQLRKRLLTWRGVTNEDRARLLDKGRELLDPDKRTTAS